MKQSITIKQVESEKEPNLKAYVDVVLGGEMKITGIKVMNHSERGLWIAMPAKKTKKVDEHNRPVYKEVCNPITAEFREELYNNVLDAYQKYEEKPTQGDFIYNAEDKSHLKVSAKMVPYESEGRNIRSIGSVTLDNSMMIHNVVINQGENGLWVSLPSQYVGKEGYRDICYPITADFRSQLNDEVLKAYEQSKNISSQEKNQNQDVEKAQKDKTPRQDNMGQRRQRKMTR